MNPLPVTDADLNAYADGQLASSRVAAIEDALARDPALAARVADTKRRNADLRDALDPWLADPIPERLIAAATGSAGAARKPVLRWLAPLMTAAAALLMGLGVGWFARDIDLERAGTPTTFTRQTALTHALYAADVNRPVEIWAPEEKRLVAWLSKRLGFAVSAPDLSSTGFALVGGRLVAGNQNPTALFMYENGDKQRLSLQVRKQPVGGGEVAFRYAVENGVGVFYWIDDNCSYALSGNLDRAQLLAVGRIVYGQLAALEAASKK
jgi:anti-sigma factor RsiW